MARTKYKIKQKYIGKVLMCKSGIYTLKKLSQTKLRQLYNEGHTEQIEKTS